MRRALQFCNAASSSSRWRSSSASVRFIFIASTSITIMVNNGDRGPTSYNHARGRSAARASAGSDHHAPDSWQNLPLPCTLRTGVRRSRSRFTVCGGPSEFRLLVEDHANEFVVKSPAPAIAGTPGKKAAYRNWPACAGGVRHGPRRAYARAQSNAVRSRRNRNRHRRPQAGHAKQRARCPPSATPRERDPEFYPTQYRPCTR